MAQGRLIIACATVIAIALGTTWLRSHSALDSATTATDLPTAAAPQPATIAPTPAANEPGSTAPLPFGTRLSDGGPSEPEHEASADGGNVPTVNPQFDGPSNDPAAAGATDAEDLEHRLAQFLYRREGRRIAAMLAEQGLAPSDSEAIVRRAMNGIASCVMEALHAEGEAQPSHETLLLALEAVILEVDMPEAEAMLRTAGMDRQVQTCVLVAAQEAGIAVP